MSVDSTSLFLNSHTKINHARLTIGSSGSNQRQLETARVFIVVSDVEKGSLTLTVGRHAENQRNDGEKMKQ